MVSLLDLPVENLIQIVKECGTEHRLGHRPPLGELRLVSKDISAAVDSVLAEHASFMLHIDEREPFPRTNKESIQQAFSQRGVDNLRNLSIVVRRDWRTPTFQLDFIKPLFDKVEEACKSLQSIELQLEKMDLQWVDGVLDALPKSLIPLVKSLKMDGTGKGESVPSLDAMTAKLPALRQRALPARNLFGQNLSIGKVYVVQERTNEDWVNQYMTVVYGAHDTAADPTPMQELPCVLASRLILLPIQALQAHQVPDLLAPELKSLEVQGTTDSLAVFMAAVGNVRPLEYLHLFVLSGVRGHSINTETIYSFHALPKTLKHLKASYLFSRECEIPFLDQLTATLQDPAALPALTSIDFGVTGSQQKMQNPATAAAIEKLRVASEARGIRVQLLSSD